MREGGVGETFVERERAAVEDEREWAADNEEEPGGSGHRNFVPARVIGSGLCEGFVGWISSVKPQSYRFFRSGLLGNIF